MSVDWCISLYITLLLPLVATPSISHHWTSAYMYLWCQKWKEQCCTLILMLAGSLQTGLTHQHGWRENLTNQWFSPISHSLIIQLHRSAVQPELVESFYCRQQAKPRHTNCRVCSALGSELGNNVMPQEVPGPALSVHNAMAPVRAAHKGHLETGKEMPRYSSVVMWRAIQTQRYICHALPLDKQIFRSELCFKIHSFTTKCKPILESGTGL